MKTTTKFNFQNLPNKFKHFNKFKKHFIPKTLIHTLKKLNKIYNSILHNQKFQNEYTNLLHNYIKHPTPLYHTKNLNTELEKTQIFLKKKNLAHTNTHKINNTLKQNLLTQQINKKHIITKTNTNQHKITTTTIYSILKQKYIIYIKKKNINHQTLNIFQIKLLNTTIKPINSKNHTLKNTINKTIHN